MRLQCFRKTALGRCVPVGYGAVGPGSGQYLGVHAIWPLLCLHGTPLFSTGRSSFEHSCPSPWIVLSLIRAVSILPAFLPRLWLK